MKVLWLSHLLPYPPKGGAPQRSFHLLGQACEWAEVDLVALRQRAMQPTPRDRAEALEALGKVCGSVSAYDIPADRSRAAWLAMVAGNLLRPRPYDAAWLRSRPLHRFLKSGVNMARYDVIHVDTIGLMQYVPSDLAHRVVLNHHNVESHMMTRRAGRETGALRKAYLRLESRKLAALERRVCGRVGLNLVVSELDRRRLVAVAGEVPAAVVDNGVDLDYFTPRVPFEARSGIVFAGGMDWYPNRSAMEYFVRDIWPLVRRAHPDLRATIVGRAPPEAVQAAGKAGRVDVTGWVDDVRPFLDRAAIYVCPIQDGGGTRLKVLDALAMTQALVATSLAVEGLDLEDGVHYLQAETPDEFRRQIDRLLDDAPLRRRLGQNGRKAVEARFGWSWIGTKLRDGYVSVGSGETASSDRHRL